MGDKFIFKAFKHYIWILSFGLYLPIQGCQCNYRSPEILLIGTFTVMATDKKFQDHYPVSLQFTLCIGEKPLSDSIMLKVVLFFLLLLLIFFQMQSFIKDSILLLTASFSISYPLAASRV